MEQIDELHQESETQQARLSELEALTEQSRMLHQEFAFHQEMIESFASAVDSATLEEKRRLLRTIVKKVVWDGKTPMCTSLQRTERRICHPPSNLCIRQERIAKALPVGRAFVPLRTFLEARMIDGFKIFAPRGARGGKARLG